MLTLTITSVKIMKTSYDYTKQVGSEFVQKYLGEGPRMVRDVFRLARENSPSVIFIDEIDAIATKRFDAQTGADREVQRILLELLNQMDGFDQSTNVKVGMILWSMIFCAYEQAVWGCREGGVPRFIGVRHVWDLLFSWKMGPTLDTNPVVSLASPCSSIPSSTTSQSFENRSCSVRFPVLIVFYTGYYDNRVEELPPRYLYSLTS